jgi:hypothetical protein
MRKLIRPFAAVVCIACLAVSGILVSAGSATTEDQVASPAKQMALTKKQIEGVLEMDEINEKLSEKARPYLIVAEQLESVAKKMALPVMTNTPMSRQHFYCPGGFRSRDQDVYRQ